jgi:phenylacetic acid degradation operon negative regulatory protein
LSWLGFGMLIPGTMVATFPMREQVLQLIEELDVRAYVHFFTASRLESADHQDIVERCWDIEAINQRYAEFIQKHEPDYLRLVKQQREGSISPQQSFIQRFWLTYDFTSIPREDPGLPDELLTEGWQGKKAISLLNDYRTLLERPAMEFLNSTLLSSVIEDLAVPA